MPTKYKRVTRPLSCAECRRLKIKCDLGFPCRHCTKRGLAGLCPDAELVNGSRRIKVLSTTEDLHRRIETLEHILKDIRPDHPALRDSMHAGPDVRQTQVASERRRLLPGRDGTHLPSDWSDRGLGCSPARSFGFPSAASRSDDQPAVAPPGYLIMGPQAGSTRYYGAASSVYLSVVGCFAAIVTAAAWETHFFHSVYPSDGRSITARPQEAAVVLFVLAIGARVGSDAPEHERAADTLATAAQLCLGLDATPTLQFVRCLMLHGYFVMNGRQDPCVGDACWPLLRMVMGLVEALGLHREPAGAHAHMGAAERAERRVVFWECHTHDVMQSVNLGRGQCIASYAIDCPTADVDGTGFHQQCWELTKILSKINTVQVRVAPSPYAEILAIDGEITAFENALPAHLAPQAAPSPFDLLDSARKRAALKRNTLSMYVHEARVALHRGWFVRALRASAREPLETDCRTSYLACLEASRGIVGLVRTVVASHGRSVRMRWHYYFHLFAACVCLAAAVIHAPRSRLAPAAMVELNAGVELFRFSQRDELEAVVNRLRQHAERRAASGGAMQDEMEESEGLDLLGARNQTIEPTSFFDLDLDMFLQQMPTPADDVPSGSQDSFCDVLNLDEGGMRTSDLASVNQLELTTGMAPAPPVEDTEVRALLAYFGLSASDG
ncbi:hypothetical protein Q5752_004876 [Cryptotrichosporon argae]